MGDPFDLTGRLAVVTGARRGIGRAMARALAEAGADVIGVSAGLEESGSDVEKDVHAAGRSFEAIRTDFADPDAVRALGEELAGRARPVDILVNNAGTIRRAPAAEHSDADWELVLQVNLNAQFALTIDPDNMALQNRAKEADMLRTEGKPTLPTRLDRELATNPFLRPHVTAIRERLGMPFAPDWKVFAEIRQRKNKA